MELRHIRYFVAVAEAGSFRRAAERLHIAQPALSRQISALEADIGTDLFEPESRRRRLSVAGESFLKDARALFAILDQSLERTRALGRGSRSRMKIAFTEIASGSEVISSLVQALRVAQPSIEVQLLPMSSTNQVDALLHGRIDAGFLYRMAGEEPRVSFECLAVDPILAVLPPDHPLASKSTLFLRDLDGQKVFLAGRIVRPDFYQSVVAAFSDAKVHPKLEEVGSAATVASLVSVGMGMGLLTSRTKSRIPSGLVTRAIADLDLKSSFGFAWPTERVGDGLRRAIGIIRDLSRQGQDQLSNQLS